MYSYKQRYTDLNNKNWPVIETSLRCEVPTEP